MNKGEHHYATHLIWDGDNTTDYTTYARAHRVMIEGKPVISASADAAFRGDAATHNPEDLFITAISSCHMLSYLALCAKYGINVLSYEDRATAIMREDGKGGGRFEEVTLHPMVTIANAEQRERAEKLHDRAHELCFIANSCSVPIHHQPEVRA